MQHGSIESELRAMTRTQKMLQSVVEVVGTPEVRAGDGKALSEPSCRARKPPKVGSPAALPSPPSAIVNAMPWGESKRTAVPSAMSTGDLLSDMRILPARWLGFRAGNM